jgi:glutamine amidotransferase/cyclase
VILPLGADKISIGSDAVYAVEEYARTGEASGQSSIEQIARVYGNQAVVISVDPRRVTVPSSTGFHTGLPHPHRAERRALLVQCGQGGREGRPVDAVTSRGLRELGAGEVLLNSIDRDGTKSASTSS